MSTHTQSTIPKGSINLDGYLSDGCGSVDSNDSADSMCNNKIKKSSGGISKKLLQKKIELMDDEISELERAQACTDVDRSDERQEEIKVLIYLRSKLYLLLYV